MSARSRVERNCRTCDILDRKGLDRICEEGWVAILPDGSEYPFYFWRYAIKFAHDEAVKRAS